MVELDNDFDDPANNRVNSKSSGIDPSSEVYVHHSDSGNYSLATDKLNGDNYNQWRRSAEISLIAKNKLSFVKGTCRRPSDDDPQALLWDRCDNFVISWLLHSIEPQISNSVLYYKTAAEIWKDLEDRHWFHEFVTTTRSYAILNGTK